MVYQQIYKKSLCRQNKILLLLLLRWFYDLNLPPLLSVEKVPWTSLELERALFLQDLRKHFEFGRFPMLEYLQNCMIQIRTTPM